MIDNTRLIILATHDKFKDLVRTSFIPRVRNVKHERNKGFKVQTQYILENFLELAQAGYTITITKDNKKRLEE